MKLIIVIAFITVISFNMRDRNVPESIRETVHDQKPIIKFGIISDVQYCDCEPAGTRFYRSSNTKLREAVKKFQDISVSFILDLGDLIDRDYLSFTKVLDIIDSSGLKTYHVTGNHDYSVDPKFKRKIPVLKLSGEGYYAFSYEKYRFICLNGNEISTYGTNNKTTIRHANDYISYLKNSGEINAVNWNGGISPNQISWLTFQLDEASSKGEKVLLMCHFPVYPDNVHNLLNYKELLAIMEKYSNIIAWFNGHNHSGNYGIFNKIHFVTFKGMVETDQTNSFASVEIYPDKIWIKGYGREKNQILAY